MPVPYIKKLANGDKSKEKDLESKWHEAKQIASKEGKDDNYAYITAIFKNLAGITEEVVSEGKGTRERIGGIIKQDILHSEVKPAEFELNSTVGEFICNLIDEHYIWLNPTLISSLVKTKLYAVHVTDIARVEQLVKNSKTISISTTIPTSVYKSTHYETEGGVDTIVCGYPVLFSKFDAWTKIDPLSGTRWATLNSLIDFNDAKFEQLSKKLRAAYKKIPLLKNIIKLINDGGNSFDDYANTRLKDVGFLFEIGLDSLHAGKSLTRLRPDEVSYETPENFKRCLDLLQQMKTASEVAVKDFLIQMLECYLTQSNDADSIEESEIVLHDFTVNTVAISYNKILDTIYNGADNDEAAADILTATVEVIHELQQKYNIENCYLLVDDTPDENIRLCSEHLKDIDAEQKQKILAMLKNNTANIEKFHNGIVQLIADHNKDIITSICDRLRLK